LIDYEVEIGFVLLADFDLSQPIDADRFWNNVAFFTANDVTDRRPIVLDGDEGFTRGKTGIGFLPVGPWLVHGRYLRPGTRGDNELALRLWLRIEENIDQTPMFRQNSNTNRMIRGPREILAMLPDIHAVSSRNDSNGKAWDIAKKDATGLSLPFGSIILSGTPLGTAIEAPDGFDRLRLITRGRFSSSLARNVFVGHLVRYRKEMGYLSEGDIVETGVEVLGVQRWVVQQ
jgi:2-keto-4-pentenoate hydratase/2-oxohepta-3-ene-1,7-dioic acid hydratase in catechol pathway